MRLELHRYKIEDVQWGRETRVQGHTLLIHREGLLHALSLGPEVAIEVYICRPGERTRITNILDIVEPRAKSPAGKEVFSGFLGPAEKVGDGVTKVLEGVAVMEVAPIPRVQEGLVDMGGPGAAYSPFSRTNNVVLFFEPPAGTDLRPFERTVRLAGLRASAYLATAGLQAEPQQEEIFELKMGLAGSDKRQTQPWIAYIYMLQSQGFLRDTFFYGRSANNLRPTWIHPNEIMDGAIVSGNYVVPCNRNPTYFHLNNPVIRELYLRHGRDLQFRGVVVCNEYSRLEEKQEVASEAVDALKRLGVEGAIITKEGGGNADTDLMLMCQACESEGIKTVLIGNEGAGTDGSDPSLAHVTTQADAFVSTGNNDERIRLEAMENRIGRGPLPGALEEPGGSLSVPVSRFNGANNLLGYGTLSARPC